MNKKKYLQSVLLYTATRALQDCRHVYLMQCITTSEIPKHIPDESVPVHGTVQCCVEVLTWPSETAQPGHSTSWICLHCCCFQGWFIPRLLKHFCL